MPRGAFFYFTQGIDLDPFSLSCYAYRSFWKGKICLMHYATVDLI